MADMTLVMLALVVGIAVGRNAARLTPGRPYRPSWTPSQQQVTQSERIARAAQFYRDGRPTRAEGVLLDPLTDWTTIAECAARHPDPRAHSIAALLSSANGPHAFLHELRRADGTVREQALQLLIRALTGQYAALPALPAPPQDAAP